MPVACGGLQASNVHQLFQSTFVLACSLSAAGFSAIMSANEPSCYAQENEDESRQVFGHAKTRKFIKDYRALRVLWDRNHQDYPVQASRYKALKYLCDKYNMTIPMVKAKIKCLRSYFSKEHGRVLARSMNGEENHESKWFAYRLMSFLVDHLESSAKRPDNGSVKQEKYSAPEIESHDVTSFNLSDNDMDQSNDEFDQPISIKSKKLRYDDTIDMTADNYEEVTPKATVIGDEYSIFGQLIAEKIRKMSKRNRIKVQQQINTILYQIEIEEIGDET